MRVRVELFGRAATQSGERETTLALPDGATLRDVAAALVARHPILDWIPRICRPARNLEYARWDDPVADGDEVSFIPPVSGGTPGSQAVPVWVRRPCPYGFAGSPRPAEFPLNARTPECLNT